MAHLRPRTRLQTHDVTNQPPPFEDINLFDNDAALIGAVEAAGGEPHGEHLSAFGRRVGSAEVLEWGEQAEKNPPVLKSFDRYGQRLDEVEFHPAYHALMDLGLSAGVAGAAWRAETAGHTLHAALLFLMGQAESGVCCPMSMTYASAATLARAPHLAEQWMPLVASCAYDARFMPASQKTAATIGMAMTEKQGGSDVRANTTRAEQADGAYALHGHKWFCSAPMCDAFLTLAYLDEGLSCFLVPRWKPDGERNAIHIMRLKNKLGDRANASSEIEYHGAYAELVGEPGRGVRVIIDMVQLTRLDCIVGSASAMRASLARALWHAEHRTAFQKKLIDQPAMTRVLGDLTIESEAATALAFRIAHATDRAPGDEQEAAFARLATPIAKFWSCKRQPAFVYEALECHGGAGFIEEGAMARLYRTAPLNAIWEGSGNVIAIDALRAIQREPESLEAVIAEAAGAHGANRHYDAHVRRLTQWLEPGALNEGAARTFVEDVGLALAGAALKRTAPDFVFDAFCNARLDANARRAHYGATDALVDLDSLIQRAAPF
jgi:putative acyl-CoA dehydrogenase